MFKVDQTQFGGKDAPAEQQGNCFQACVATLLQIPLEEAFDSRYIEAEDWIGEFNKWLEPYGLGCVFLYYSEEHPLKTTGFKGIAIAELMSATLYNGERHVVVVRDHLDLLHDPLPGAKEQGDLQGVYVFSPLEPYKMARHQGQG